MIKRILPQSFLTLFAFLSVVIVPHFSLLAEEEKAPDYQQQIQPILNEYCAGCHNEVLKEGDFSAESYKGVRAGLEDRPVVLPNDPEGSLLLRLIEGRAKPSMPPEGEAAPEKEEIALIRKWIESGAAGPQGEQPDQLSMKVPRVSAFKGFQPITAVEISSRGEIAIGRFREVGIAALPELEDLPSQTVASKPRLKLEKVPGKVNSLSFSNKGDRILVASGLAGRAGWIGLYETEQGELLREFRGHNDTIYDARLSPDGKTLATCSYDQTIIIWDARSGEQRLTLDGHNGAVYDLAFSPDGTFLVSASADETCKVWRISDGKRFDTLGQPLQEARVCLFSPDGERIAAVGADRKLRVWKMVSRETPTINPQLVARFAHEDVISHLLWTRDGSHLLTFAQDGIIKLWDAETIQEKYVWDEAERATIANAALNPDQKTFYVARLDGSLTAYRIPQVTESRPTVSRETASDNEIESREFGETATLQEKEPNNLPEQANKVSLPATIEGTISGQVQGEPDFDLYRISCREGETWVVEVNAARKKSPLDSFVEVLDAEGNKILRVRLQATRESYFTFRGKNSDQINDFRVFNWTEMKLNEYLYANGEVAKLYHYPRGADSGFNVYPGKGKRWGYFGTTPLAHALNEPCYVVEAYEPDEEIVPNGLPVFPIHYENDDASRRELGKDSRLFFEAPKTGDYLVKISDVRDFAGSDFKYDLTIRPPSPDFQPHLLTNKLTLHPGSHEEFSVGIDRVDRFDGPVTFFFENVPGGVEMTSPVTIEAGQIEAQGVISWNEGTELDPEWAKQVTIRAEATIDGEKVVHDVGGFAEWKSGGESKLTLEIVPSERSPQPVSSSDADLLEFEIHPGQTIPLKVIANRNGFEGRISFGKEGSGRNLPFGLYVDNIGLNGLMITEGNSEREFFITCDEAARPQSRLFHLRTGSAGGQATQPVLLHVKDE